VKCFTVHLHDKNQLRGAPRVRVILICDAMNFKCTEDGEGEGVRKTTQHAAATSRVQLQRPLIIIERRI